MDLEKCLFNRLDLQSFGKGGLSTSWEALAASVPPPPSLPLPASQPPQNSHCTEVVSMGSIGHPHSCAPACRYVKRKGGCGHGAMCRRCHMCFWRRRSSPNRTESKLEKMQRPEPADDADQADTLVEGADNSGEAMAEESTHSVGTEGHPYNCGPACRYVKRKGGCRLGADCPNCHECKWRHGEPNGKEGIQVEESGEVRTSTGFSFQTAQALEKLIQFQLYKAEQGQDEASVELRPECPSIGSFGHPRTCNLPCKYHAKANGCKDGQNCIRCHLCRWARKPKDLPILAPASGLRTS